MSDALGITLSTLFIVFIVYYFFHKVKEEASKPNYPNTFTPTQEIIGSNGRITIDEQRKKVCLYSLQLKTIISYKDLLSSELIEDGETVTKTMRGSQIGGALVGGVLLGGVGAIIGGLSGKTKTSGNVNKIDLRVTINNTKNPIFYINFLNKETKRNGVVYQEAMQKARSCHGLIEVLIKQADIEDKEKSKDNITHIQQISVADELKKLAELRDSGVLSNEEFQQQKTRLLGS